MRTITVSYKTPPPQIRALLEKNYKIRKHRYCQTVSQFFIVIFFCFVFILGLHIFTDLTEHKNPSYREFSPIELLEEAPKTIITQTNSSRVKIAYSPNNNAVLNQAFSDTSETVIESIMGFRNSEEMENSFRMNTKENILAGIDFGDQIARKSSLPDEVSIKIRFPSELRFTVDEKRKYWSTNILYEGYRQQREVRDYNLNEGAIPSYFEEGFLGLQQLITYYLILAQKNLTGGFREHLPKIVMERFPRPSFTFYINVSKYNRCACALGVSFAFVVACHFIIETIVSEKQSLIRAGMKTMGLRDSTNFLAMIIWSFLELSFPAILIIFSLLIIPVKEHRTVCNYSDWSLVIFLITLYVLMLISYCLFLSAIFSRAKVAGVISTLIYFLQIALYMAIYNTKNSTYILICNFIPPMAICFSVRELITFENLGKGVQWSSIWIPSLPESTYSLGIAVIIFAINIILFTLLSLYLEAVIPNEQGLAKPWYYIFVSSCWKCRSWENQNVRISFEEEDEITGVIEAAPQNLIAAVTVKNLYKIENSRLEIKNASFSIYENNITVMLGHYGAGKSKIISLITGMIPATSGSVVVYDCDIRKDTEKCRKFFGLAPEFSMLFEHLTVEEHIRFYCQLKGCNSKILKQEVDNYLNITELTKKKNFRPPDLILTMKRKLSIAIAFCGNSKVVLLDEPTAGLDMESKTSIWQLLKKLKGDRAVMLTTYESEEAEYIADRIIILSNGEVQSCGSTDFIRNFFGIGPRLVINKTSGFNSNKLANNLSTYMKNIQILSDVNNTIVYLLPKYSFRQIKTMLKYLEDNREKLKIVNYSLSVTTLESLFLKPSISIEKNFSELSKTKPDVKLLKGIRLVGNQILAILFKRAILIKRYWYLHIIAFLLPALLLLLSFFTNKKYFVDNLPALEFNIADYKNTVILIVGNTTNEYEATYRQVIESSKGKIKNVENIRNFYVPLTKSHSDMLYLLGASFGLQNDTKPKIKLWFNNWPLHTPGLALQLALQTVYKNQLGKNHNIRFVNHPYEFKLESRRKQSMDLSKTRNSRSTGVFYVGAIICMLSVFYIYERVSNSKHLQVISGMKTILFWLTSYLVDFICSVFVVMSAVITIGIWRTSYFHPLMELATIFTVLTIYCCTYLPMIYVLSVISSEAGRGYFALIFLLSLTFIGIIPVVHLIYHRHPKTTRAIESLSILLFHPYAAYRAVQKVYGASNLYRECVDMINMCVHSGMERSLCKRHICEKISICCRTNVNYFNLEEYRLTWHLICMSIHGIVWWIIVFILEFRFLSLHLLLKFRENKNQLQTEDDDAKQEKKKITETREAEIRRQYAVVLKDVSKSTCCFRSCLSLKRIFLAIDNKELFCFLGLKGAGKTTLLRILTGNLNVTYGKAWVMGYNVHNKINKVRKHLGYCPQYESYPNFMTANEILMMYSLIKGIPSNKCKLTAKRMANELDFAQHLDTKAENLNGSVRRKLSLAIALIGKPDVLLLDEPTTGLDSNTKRQIWQHILVAHARGLCIILATKDIRECEALATRGTMMVHGEVSGIGSIQQLKIKCSQEDALIVQVYSEAETEGIKMFLAKNFQKCRLVDCRYTVLTFVLEDKRSWSEKLLILEKAKNKRLIQDYSLSQSSFEDKFLRVMRKQNPTVHQFV